MGTETHLHVLNNQRLKGYLVKLNNPHNGSEEINIFFKDNNNHSFIGWLFCV